MGGSEGQDEKEEEEGTLEEVADWFWYHQFVAFLVFCNSLFFVSHDLSYYVWGRFVCVDDSECRVNGFDEIFI